MRRLLVMALVAAALVLIQRPVPADAAAGCVDGPFGPELAQLLEARFPGKRMTAAVYDTRDGCEYLFLPDHRVTTASVVKVEVMAGVLLRAQQQGRALTQSERDRIGPMITQSADAPTSELWSSLGGRQGMASLDRTFGLGETTAVGPTWGLTITSARDQVQLLRQVLIGDPGPLAPAYRAEARGFMTSVVSSQRWGVTAGVPGGWVVAQKNGFASSQCCRWRINSVGVVEDPAGGSYVVSILSDGWPDQPSGIDAVEVVSRAIAAKLARVPYGPLPSAAAFVGQQYRDLLGRNADLGGLLLWTSFAGTDTGRAGAVIEALALSPEGSARELLARLYVGAFARIPDAQGFAYWEQRRASAEDVADAFARSAELGGGSGDNGAFVDLLYQRLFHRAPDVTGRSYWVGELGRGVSRGTVLLALAQSTEHRSTSRAEVTVVLGYWGMLGRMPDQAGYDAWVARIDAQSWPMRTFAAALFSSAEYAARV